MQNGNIVPPADVSRLDGGRKRACPNSASWLTGRATASWFAVGNSGLKTGAYVGGLGADILNGADPATMPIVDPKQTDTTFNLARARSLEIEFPPDELAAADNVFETISGQ